MLFAFQKIVVEMKDARTESDSYEGSVRRVEGKNATVQLQSGSLGTSGIKSIYTVGKEDHTMAEQDRMVVILSVLQGRSRFFDTPVVEAVFLSTPRKPQQHRREVRPVAISGKIKLNPSQKDAIDMILSTHEDDKIGVVHGPPGTGKTTVIATAVFNLASCAPIGPKAAAGIWLVAQSNVAVKNIAEKLASVDFLNFKIIVSKDFHYDWSVILPPILMISH